MDVPGGKCHEIGAPRRERARAVDVPDLELVPCAPVVPRRLRDPRAEPAESTTFARSRISGEKKSGCSAFPRDLPA
eukprot:9238473-Pyramimonas_sp.AAC.1